jgi:hypothetical protein
VGQNGSRTVTLRGIEFGEAEVDDRGPAGRAGHHVGGPQRPVRDVGPVQLAHLCPQPREQVVAELAGGQPVKRAAVGPGLHEQHGVSGPDDPVDTGCGNPGPFGHQLDEGLMLNRVKERRGGPGVADIPQPYRPVRPVQQVGVALIRAQGLDEQHPAVRRDRRERSRAPGLDLGRTDRLHRQARVAQHGRDPGGPDPPVRDTERHQHRRADRDPGGEGQEQLHRQDRAGQEPRA